TGCQAVPRPSGGPAHLPESGHETLPVEGAASGRVYRAPTAASPPKRLQISLRRPATTIGHSYRSSNRSPDEHIHDCQTSREAGKRKTNHETTPGIEQ